MFLSIHQNHCVNHVSLLHKQKTQRNFNLEQSNATRPYCQNGQQQLEHMVELNVDWLI